MKSAYSCMAFKRFVKAIVKQTVCHSCLANFLPISFIFSWSSQFGSDRKNMAACCWAVSKIKCKLLDTLCEQPMVIWQKIWENVEEKLNKVYLLHCKSYCFEKWKLSKNLDLNKHTVNIIWIVFRIQKSFDCNILREQTVWQNQIHKTL